MKNLKKQFISTFVIGAVLLTGIAVLVNMIFHNLNVGRLDLTSDQIYKLSPSVTKILTELEAPIEITYYVSSSEKMPTMWKNLERDVIDKLKDLKAASNGKLSYTVFDPSAEEEKETYEEQKQKEVEASGEANAKPGITRKKIAERLYEKGVIPFGVQSTERDEFAVKRVYSSIVLSYLDRKEDIIEEVRPETFGSLEYEIMSRIYKLISNKRPKIGFYPALPEVPPQQMQYMRQQPEDMYEGTVTLLKEQGYDVTRTNIKEDDPIPEDIQTMVLMLDQPLNDRQLYEIDKLIHDGVHIVLAANMHNYQVMPAQNRPGEFDLRGMPTQININDLVKNYGFEFDNKMFMDKSTSYIQVPVYQTRSMGMFQVREQRMEPVTKPVLIRVTSDYINHKLSISNKITDIFYMYGTRLMVHDEKMNDSLSYETLFTSSDFSWTREGHGYGPISEDPPSEENVLRRQPLGILVKGYFNPKYVNMNIPDWPADPAASDEYGKDPDAVPSEITGKAKENKIIAIGNSNLFKAMMLNSLTSHKALLVNCVDALTLGDELINIRSKNIEARRIKETSPVAKGFTKMFVVWFSPLVFVMFGIFINIKRKKR